MKRSVVALMLGGLVAALVATGCSGGKKTAGIGLQPADRLPAPSQPVVGSGEADETAADLSFRDIRFEYDKHALVLAAKQTLSEHAKRLAENPALTMLIEGHCDERGTSDYNLALGERRAQAAAEYLIAYGVGRNRIATISYGKERPLDPRHSEEGWAANRRDAFVVTSGSGKP